MAAALRMILKPDATPAIMRVHSHLSPLKLVQTVSTSSKPVTAILPTYSKEGYILSASQKAVDLIALSEGWRARAYICPAGKPTIGYGHTHGVTHADVRARKTITKDKGIELLLADMKWAAAEVAKLKLTNQNQFDALVSLVFNIGAGKWKRSTLRKLMVKGQYHLAAKQFARWVYVKGEVSRGLTIRRIREHELFTSAA